MDLVFYSSIRLYKQSVLYIAEMITLTALSQLLTLEVYKVLMMINFCTPRFGKYFEMSKNFTVNVVMYCMFFFA